MRRKEAVLALRHAKKAMRAAGLSAEQIDGFVRQIDGNCAGPCKTRAQAYGSMIYALADALSEAESDLAETEQYAADGGT